MQDKKDRQQKKTTDLTFEEMKALPRAEQETLFTRLNSSRSKAKVVNFSAVYGAGAPKIAQSTGMSLIDAEKLHKTYWERNKAVKLVAKNAKHKTVKFNGQEQMWLLNPISGFWYSLRTEKDKFSTLNQGKSFALNKFA